jgi:hypothetical protein
MVNSVYLYYSTGIVKTVLFKTLLRKWAERFEIIIYLVIKFGLLVPVIDETCGDPDEFERSNFSRKGFSVGF